MQLDLRRGALFDASALDYDRYRPGYPAEAIGTVVSLSGLKSSSRLLEIGCGTGKATVHFASRGFMIECVDPGQRLIALARHNCRRWPNVTFRNGSFESVHLEAQHYDLVYSAQAFHWVDPRIRLPKTAALLPANGSLALLYNYPGKAKDGVLRLLNEAIEEESDGRLEAWDYAAELTALKREIRACGLFRGIKLLRYRWTNRYSAEGYTGLFRTYSDFLSLSRRTQERVLHRIRMMIRANGGYIDRPYDCVLIHAHRNRVPRSPAPS
jgi:SAM-dependent methyltransferase